MYGIPHLLRAAWWSAGLGRATVQGKKTSLIQEGADFVVGAAAVAEVRAVVPLLQLDDPGRHSQLGVQLEMNTCMCFLFPLACVFLLF